MSVSRNPSDAVAAVPPRCFLTVAVSSRCLFDLDADDAIYREHGLDAYVNAQLKRIDEPLSPGPAFPLLRAMLALNTPGDEVVRAVVASGQHPFMGMRVMTSARHHGLEMRSAAFTGGQSPVPYLSALETDLFLTRNSDDAQAALDAGIAAAVLGPLAPFWKEDEDGPLRVALDGDAVIFSDACEAVSKRDGLEAFYERQGRLINEPMADGPFAGFLRGLHALRMRRPGRVRISLVTARNSVGADRALRTLMAWGVQPDDAFFMGGLSKGGIIRALRPHIFLDDAERHVKDCTEHAPSGRVPYLTIGELARLSASDREAAGTAAPDNSAILR